MQTPQNINISDQLLHWQSRLERIKEYVLTNLTADLSAGSVAQKFGLNESTLRYLFQSQEDESFHTYVERIRMNKAVQLLAEGKWVKEAMREVGYKNRGTFNNAFKKRFKHTPGSFKK